MNPRYILYSDGNRAHILKYNRASQVYELFADMADYQSAFDAVDALNNGDR